MEKETTQNSALNISTIFKIAIIILLLLIFLSITVFGFIFAFSYIQSQKPVSTIIVNGQSKKKIEPTDLSFNFSIEERGENKEEINKKVDQKTDKTIDYLSSQGIQKQKIKTNKSSFSDRPYIPNDTVEGLQNKKTQEVVTTFFQVDASDIQDASKKLNEWNNELTKIGISNFYQNPLLISDETKKEVCKELEKEAMKDAKENIQSQLDMFGENKKVIKTEIIEQGGSCATNAIYPYMARGGAVKTADSSSSPEVLGGEIELTSEVKINVDYR